MDWEIDPPLHAMLAENARAAAELGSDVASARALYARSYRLHGPRLPDGVSWRSVEAEVPMRIYQPRSRRDDRLILYFHGGGFVLGSAEVYHAQSAMIASATGRRVVTPDYRLAPEHPFPAAPEDAICAHRWCLQNLNVRAKDIILAGDSAGACLALSTALAAVRSGQGVGRLVLLYPVSSMILPPDAPSFVDFATGYHLETQEMHWFLDHYLPSSGDRLNPLASPALDPDLGRLPPIQIFSARPDPIFDDAARLYQRLVDLAVKVEHQVFDRVLHNFVEHMSISAASFMAVQKVLSCLAR